MSAHWAVGQCIAAVAASTGNACSEEVGPRDGRHTTCQGGDGKRRLKEVEAVKEGEESVLQGGKTKSNKHSGLGFRRQFSNTIQWGK